MSELRGEKMCDNGPSGEVGAASAFSVSSFLGKVMLQQ